MSINLLSNVEIFQFRVYSVETKDKEFIDKMFNKLHA